MQSQTDWMQILVRCKENVKKSIQIPIKNLSKPQPDLGIGAGGDPIKPVDLAAEKAIIEVLHQYHVTFTLVSEESGIREFGDNPNQCYVTVDPIDGTNNLVRGVPFYATSIAISAKPSLSTVSAALVADMFHDVTYTALSSKGAYRNGEKIKSSPRKSLENALVGLDLNSSTIKEIAPQILDLMGQTEHIRHFGANALELCYVADGTIDTFIDIRGKLRTTDLAAAYLIVKEAGGTLTRSTGEDLDTKLDPKQTIKFIASGNAKIHKKILNLVKT